MKTYRTKDRATWNDIFRNVPAEWFAAGPSDAMVKGLAFFRQSPVHRLLDVGAGIGRWAVYFARHSVEPVVTVESAHHGARVTARWAEREKLAIRAVTGDAVTLPFADAAFDAILAALVLEHLDPLDRQAALAELRRVTQPGARGWFVFNPILSDAEMAPLAQSDNPTRNCHCEPWPDARTDDLLA